MTYLTHSLLFFFSSFSLLICFSIAGSRPVHGPAYTNPSAFSPAAYDFFHPKSSLTNDNPPKNSPSPSPSKAPNNLEADTQGSKVSSDEHINGNSKDDGGQGEGIGILIGVSSAAFLLMGIYFVIKKRRANITRTIIDSV